MFRYEHTQPGPVCMILYGAAVGTIALGLFVREPAALVICAAAAAVLTLVAASFQQLTVRDEGDWLLVAFGPLPVFRRKVRYEDIVCVDVGRTRLVDGWGIHKSSQGGWVWNIWGFDCVTLTLKKSRLQIGTDDPHNLAEFLTSRITSQATADGNPH